MISISDLIERSSECQMNSVRLFYFIEFVKYYNIILIELDFLFKSVLLWMKVLSSMMQILHFSYFNSDITSLKFKSSNDLFLFLICDWITFCHLYSGIF